MCKCGSRPRAGVPDFVVVDPFRSALPNIGLLPTLVNAFAPKFSETTANFCSKPSNAFHTKGIPGISNITSKYLNQQVDKAWNKYCECIRPCPETGNCKCPYYRVNVSYERSSGPGDNDWVTENWTFGMYGPVTGAFIITETDNLTGRVSRMAFNAARFDGNTKICRRAIVTGNGIGWGSRKKPTLRNLQITGLTLLYTSDSLCDDGSPPDFVSPDFPDMPFTNYYFPLPGNDFPRRTEPDVPKPPPQPCNCDDKGDPFRLPSIPRFPNPFGSPQNPIEGNPLPPPYVPINPDLFDKGNKMNCCDKVAQTLAIANQMNTKLFDLKLQAGQIRKDVDTNRQFLVSIYADTRTLKSDISNVRGFAQNAFKKADEAAFLAKQIKPLHETEMRRINNLQLWMQTTILGAITAQSLALAKLITGSLAVLYTSLRTEFLKVLGELRAVEGRVKVELSRAEAKIIDEIRRIRIVTQEVKVVTEKPIIRTQEVKVTQEKVNVVTQEVRVTTESTDLSGVLRAIKGVDIKVGGLQSTAQAILDNQLYIETTGLKVWSCKDGELEEETLQLPLIRSKSLSTLNTYRKLFETIHQHRTCKEKTSAPFDLVELGTVTDSRSFSLPAKTIAVKVQIVEIPKGRSARLNMTPPLNYPNSGWFSWKSGIDVFAEERIEYESSIFVPPTEFRADGCYVSVYFGYVMKVFARVAKES